MRYWYSMCGSDEKRHTGNFAKWLSDFIKAMEGKGNNSVPCGHCVACCTSSNFVHIRPSDIDTLKHIPEEILFPAPKLPKGHFVLGYDEMGHCPMFKEGKCSIYEQRPTTCRQYDCRVYAATGISVENEKSDIAKQVNQWKFDMSSDIDFKKYTEVKKASRFLLNYKDRFPTKCRLHTNSQLAVFAIKIHSLFSELELPIQESGHKAIINRIISTYCES